jgi:hypothetical protein
MKFFPNPEKKLAAAIASREAVAARLAAARGAVTECTTSLHQLAVQGADDAALAAGEAKLLEAERRVSTLSPALAEIEALVATLESDRAKALDEKTRAATAVSANELGDEIKQAAASLDIALATMVDVSARAIPLTYDATGTNVFCQSARIEIAAASEVVSLILREYGRRVLNGQEPAAFPTPAPPPVKPVPIVREQLTQVFLTKAVKWRDQDGKQRSCGKCLDCELPPKAAARALAIGAATRLDHPERKKNLGQWPSNYNLATAIDLDSEIEPSGPIVLHSAFEPMPDVRKPFTLRVATGGAS